MTTESSQVTISQESQSSSLNNNDSSVIPDEELHDNGGNIDMKDAAQGDVDQSKDN